jgi:hypothetical protein
MAKQRPLALGGKINIEAGSYRDPKREERGEVM